MSLMGYVGQRLLSFIEPKGGILLADTCANKRTLAVGKSFANTSVRLSGKLFNFVVQETVCIHEHRAGQEAHLPTVGWKRSMSVMPTFKPHIFLYKAIGRGKSRSTKL